MNADQIQYLQDNDMIGHDADREPFEPGTIVRNVTTGETVVWPPATEPVERPAHNGVFDPADPAFQFPY
jgi:hypothetical protein